MAGERRASGADGDGAPASGADRGRLARLIDMQELAGAGERDETIERAVRGHRDDEHAHADRRFACRADQRAYAARITTCHVTEVDDDALPLGRGGVDRPAEL